MKYKKYLLFDVESSKLWNKRVHSMHEDQAFIVQIAGYLLDENYNIEKRFSFIFNPPNENATISESAESIHGISTEQARKYGVSPFKILQMIRGVLDGDVGIIAHNAYFDSKFLFRFAKNNKERVNLIKAQENAICTMLSSKEYMKMPPTEAMKKYKWLKYKNPKLIELHQFLFNEGFDGEHDANQDVEATYRCFKELLKRKVIKI